MFVCTMYHTVAKTTKTHDYGSVLKNGFNLYSKTAGRWYFKVVIARFTLGVVRSVVAYVYPEFSYVYLSTNEYKPNCIVYYK